MLTQPQADKYRNNYDKQGNNVNIVNNFNNIKEERTAYAINREQKRLKKDLGLA